MATIFGTSGVDTLTGDTDPSNLNDTIFGGDGNDVLSGGNGNDTVLGEVGDDVLGELAVSLSGFDSVSFSEPGNDVLKGGSGTDICSGGDGNDQLFGESGGDFLGDFNLDLKGDASGQSFSLTSSGSEAGNDKLDGSSGSDFIGGGAGDDQLIGGDGADFLGELSSRFSASIEDSSIGSINISGVISIFDSGNDRIDGGGGNDIISGGNGNDNLLGGIGDDIIGQIRVPDSQNISLPSFGDVSTSTTITGSEAGDDCLEGGVGNDILNGGSGQDILIGVNPIATGLVGRGEVDRLTGGVGADTFVLGGTEAVFYRDRSKISDGKNDYAVVEDFRREQGDRIQLKGRSRDYIVRKIPAGFLSQPRNSDTPIGGGQGIFLKAGQRTPELIAIVQGNKSVSLNKGFVFV
jgi:Ca2+-binding RTX toxin-like protein